MSRLWITVTLALFAIVSILVFLGSDFMIQNNTPSIPPKNSIFKKMFSRIVDSDEHGDNAKVNLQKHRQTEAPKKQKASHSSRTFQLPESGNDETNVNKTAFPRQVGYQSVLPQHYRRPLQNGTIDGMPDPGKYIPCAMGGDHPQKFKRGSDRTMYRYYLSKSGMLETHRDDGQYCFIAYEVTNVVFNLQWQPGWCCIYVPALHVPSKKFVGADIHFHDYLIRDIVNSQLWGEWRERLIADTEPIRHVWWDKFLQGSAGGITTPGSSKYISAEIIQEASDLALELISGKKKPKQEPSTIADPSIKKRGKEVTMMDFVDKPRSPPLHQEESSLLTEVPPSAVQMLPVRTEYAHLMITDLVRTMPAVSVAELISYWGHFYSSGLQALGPDRITIIVTKRNYSGHLGAKLIDSFSRYFPVPALYLATGVTYFAKKLTFAPRAYHDVVEPCAFHFLYHWLVPTVVERFHHAMKNGRGAGADEKNNINNGETQPAGAPEDYTWSPHGNVEQLAPGVFLRQPVPPEKEIPWWPKEFDELIANPPENLIILKTRSGAAFSRRIFPITPYLKQLAKENNFHFVSDSAPHDVRLYLINHAKRLVIMWGGGATVHSHLWGGGVKKRSEEKYQQIRLLDVILLIHPGYDWEFRGFYEKPLRNGGVNVTNDRQILQGGLTTFMCPPNPHDQWAEAAYSFGYAWTKMIRIKDINALKRNHLFITDDEKKNDYGPPCRVKNVERMVGPRWKSKWEYKPPRK